MENYYEAKPISEIARKARENSKTTDESSVAKDDTVQIAFERYQEYGIKPNLWKLNIREIEELIQLCIKHKETMDGKDFISRILTMGDFPLMPLKMVNAIGLILHLKDYFLKQCNIPLSELQQAIVDHLKLGILDDPRNVRAVAVTFLITSVLYQDREQCFAIFGELTTMLKFKNDLSIDLHRLALEDSFSVLPRSGKMDLRFITEEQLNSILRIFEEKLENVDAMLDGRNKEVIQNNVAYMICECLTSIEEFQILAKGEKGNIVGRIDPENPVSVSISEVLGVLGDWDTLIIDGQVGTLDCLCEVGGMFFELSKPSKKNETEIVISMNTLMEMAVIHPVEFLTWIHQWMIYNNPDRVNIVEPQQ